MSWESKLINDSLPDKTKFVTQIIQYNLALHESFNILGILGWASLAHKT
jgi:hypothetical protein